MRHRPKIGSRVRLRGNVGWGDWEGRRATVLAYHGDGIACYVRVDGEKRRRRWSLILDPKNMQPVQAVRARKSV